MHHFVIGLDLAQKQDFSALCVVERPLWDGVGWNYLSQQPDIDAMTRLASSGAFAPPGDGPEPVFRVGYLRRWPRGTEYPSIVEDVAQLILRFTKVPRIRAAFVLDATGLGQPISDLLRSRDDIPAAVAVTITAGAKARQNSVTEWTVPKQDLISSVVTLLEMGRLRWSRELPDVELLEHELRAFQLKFSKAGNELFGAEGKEHDDLVIALALCCWHMLQEKNVDLSHLFVCGGWRTHPGDVMRLHVKPVDLITTYRGRWFLG